MKILVINGPNINMLGIREPAIYGDRNYKALINQINVWGAELHAEVECYQSNHEGDIVDKIQDALGKFDGIVINPAAYTHTSVAILDALKAVSIPACEVHISDVNPVSRAGSRISRGSDPSAARSFSRILAA